LSPTDGNVQITRRVTQAQYNALTSAEKEGHIFIITDVNMNDLYVINDAVTASDSVWSSQKTVTEINKYVGNFNGFKSTFANFETGGTRIYIELATITSTPPFIIKLQAQRVNTNADIQILSGTVYQSLPVYKLSVLQRAEHNGGIPTSEDVSSYLFVTSNNKVYLSLGSYSKATVQFISNDGTAVGTSYSTTIPEARTSWQIDGFDSKQDFVTNDDVTDTVDSGNMQSVTSNAVYNALDVNYEDITSECTVKNDSITIEHVYAFKQGNRVSLTFGVVTKGAPYAIIHIPQRYTIRNSDFSHQWWHYSVNNQTVIGTTNQIGEFYVMYDTSIPAGVSFVQTFDYFI
jgi:hypothetical protein